MFSTYQYLCQIIFYMPFKQNLVHVVLRFSSLLLFFMAVWHSFFILSDWATAQRDFEEHGLDIIHKEEAIIPLKTHIVDVTRDIIVSTEIYLFIDMNFT